MSLLGEIGYALIRPSVRAIGTIYADVTVEENHRDEVIITQHPVEGGGVISDHAYKRPSELEIRCGFSNSSAGSVGYVQQQYQALLALQLARKPFSVYTGKRRYQNMLIRGLSVVTDPHSENILMASVALQEIILVSTQATSAGSNGTSSGSTDTASAGSSGDQANPASTGSVANNGNVEAQGVGSQAFAGAYNGGGANPGGYTVDGSAASGSFGLGGINPATQAVVGGGAISGISPVEVTLPEISAPAIESPGGLQTAGPDQYNMFGGGP